MKLEIYDISGRRIRTLAQGRYPAGSHRVVWDGTDSRGKAGCVCLPANGGQARHHPQVVVNEIICIHAFPGGVAERLRRGVFNEKERCHRVFFQSSLAGSVW
ncbi:MAG: hypothetical protein Kow0042_24680 [Calditrichia bacterium]